MKIQHKLLIYFILIFIFTFKYIENSTLKEVRDSIKEVIYSYYMRGKYIHYNLAKDKFFSPEEATSQNINCIMSTSFTSSVFQELLNILVPYYEYQLRIYSDKREGSPEVFMSIEQINKDLTIKLYSEKEQGNYEISKNKTFKEIIQHLEIGDLLVQNDIGVIVYDKIRDENGDISDIIVASSTFGIGGGYVKTKIEKNYVGASSGWFSFFGYSLFLNNKTNKNIGDEGLEEGSIGLIKLSQVYPWSTINTQGTVDSKVLVLRFLNEKDGKAILKYDNYYNYYKGYNISDNDIIELNNKNKDRIKFKHLFIEKIVDKNHNNIVEFGELLTYKIIIKNQYKEDYTEDLIVTEYLSEFVTFKSHKENKNIKFKNDKKNNKLTWNIGKLKKKDEVIIEYTVEVKSNKLEGIIESKGYVGNIESATVLNTIGKNLKKEQINLIKKIMIN